jgi:lipopolysaccharide transport system ATP-binding protein
MVLIKEIHYVDDSGHPISIAEFGQMVNLSILFEVRTACPRVTIAFYVKDRSRLDVIGTNSDNENTSLFEVKAGELYSSRFRFALRLKQGAYSVTIILAAGPQTADYYDWIEDAVSFEVFHPTRRLYALYSPPMDVSITRFSPVV